ncbi:helix-turn-helix domain-containing protein [uncultured Eubacterium sp.]|uniref:helix-turn-helix domain-containing protein n=1 Tax=uncultured Eubacterium sp. TaxID=165185 RepID=UPI0026714D82|nr:helix-turn-helix transcriptional regulator [uncultured Eubacterium sp.]
MYKKFQELLEERQLTICKVAKEVGIAASTLYDWKNGKSTPKANKLKLLADYFEVDINYFLEKQEA